MGAKHAYRQGLPNPQQNNQPTTTTTNKNQRTMPKRRGYGFPEAQTRALGDSAGLQVPVLPRCDPGPWEGREAVTARCSYSGVSEREFVPTHPIRQCESQS